MLKRSALTSILSHQERKGIVYRLAMDTGVAHFPAVTIQRLIALTQASS
jgi:hypothetical protein